MREIPCVLMRGGTSKAAFFRREDLPEQRSDIEPLLLGAMGSPDPRQIDGLGGAQTVTSKVAIISKSDLGPNHVDYLFAQVDIANPVVDWGPTCGNIVIAVGPYSIEQGLVEPAGQQTPVVIHSVNTGATIEAIVETPEDQVTYAGDVEIAGVPGTAAPVQINFLDAIGSKTGKLFPTGNRIDRIQGLDVTCIDVAMPMVIARAEDFGKTGHETKADLDADRALLDRIEDVRLEAGRAMGMGDVTGKVTPKFGLLAAPATDAHVTSRYFVPTDCHPTHAVSGAICVASCVALDGTIARGLARPAPTNTETIVIEHPQGTIEVALSLTGQGADRTIDRAGVVRTARRLMSGNVAIPD